MIRRNHQVLLDERTAAARNRQHGIIALIVIAAILAGTGLAYVNPTGKADYTAHLVAAAGVRPGDDVRIAGINVGKVTGVRLDKTEVEMKFNVQQSVRVGSESTLDIRMLTPLGGHYLALDPKGDIPLGRKVLPMQQVTVPFEVNDIIQAMTPLIKEVDGQVIHDTFTQVAGAANRYPDALRDVIGYAAEMTGSLSKVTDEFHRSMDFANHGLRAMVSGRNQLVTLVEQITLMGQTYTAKSVDIVEFFAILSELARMVKRFMVFYGREVAPVANGIDDIIDTLIAHPDRLGRAAENLGQIAQIVIPMLSGNGVVIDEGHFLVPGQDLCLPNVMKQC